MSDPDFQAVIDTLGETICLTWLDEKASKGFELTFFGRIDEEPPAKEDVRAVLNNQVTAWWRRANPRYPRFPDWRGQFSLGELSSTVLRMRESLRTHRREKLSDQPWHDKPVFSVERQLRNLTLKIEEQNPSWGGVEVTVKPWVFATDNPSGVRADRPQTSTSMGLNSSSAVQEDVFQQGHMRSAPSPELDTEHVEEEHPQSSKSAEDSDGVDESLQGVNQPINQADWNNAILVSTDPVEQEQHDSVESESRTGDFARDFTWIEELVRETHSSDQ